jgi:L-asparaginase
MARRIAILATGGTIAGTRRAGDGYTAATLSGQELLSALPGCLPGIDVRCEQIANVGSQSMTGEIWLHLMHRINALQSAGSVDAIVVTHGTDTLEETAYFLHLTTLGKCPVILTGAMKPADAHAPDGPENLLHALTAAQQPELAKAGVLVLMDGWLHSARYVYKTGNPDQAFVSWPSGPVGQIREGHAKLFHGGPDACHTFQSHFSNNADVAELANWPQVPVFYATAHTQPQWLASWLEQRPLALVVAGVGAGNVDIRLLDMLAQAVHQQVVVVRSSHCDMGRVARNIEIDDDRFGFIAAGDLNPQKARVLLMVALAAQTPVSLLQQVFNTY